MPTAAVEIIDARPKLGRYVFTLNGKKPYAGHKRCKSILDRESGVSDWTFHDLRRTAASGMASLHVAQDPIDRVLNHGKGKLARTYNTYDYRVEKAAALKAWAERVAIVVGKGITAPNVAELRARA
jgi:integrase